MGIFGDDSYNGKKGWDGMYGDKPHTAKKTSVAFLTTKPTVSLGYTPGEDLTPGAPDAVIVVTDAPKTSTKSSLPPKVDITTPDSPGAVFLYNTTDNPEGVLVKTAKNAGMVVEDATGAVTKTATALVDAGFGATAATLKAGASVLKTTGDAVSDTVSVPYDLVKEIGSYNSAPKSALVSAERANYWDPTSVRKDTEDFWDPFEESFSSNGILSHLSASRANPVPVYTANSARRIIDSGGAPLYSGPILMDSETLHVEKSGKPGTSFEVTIGISGEDLIRSITRLVREKSYSSMSANAAMELARFYATYAWITARSTEIMCLRDSDPVTVDGLLSREQIGWLQNDQFSNGERVLFTGVPPCNGEPMVFMNVPYKGYEEKIKPCLEKRTCPVKVARVLSESQTRTTTNSNNGETIFGVRYAIPIKGDTSLERCIKSALRTKNLRNDYARPKNITVKYDKNASTDAIAYFDVTVKTNAVSFDETAFTSMLAKLIAQTCDGKNGMGRSISDWNDPAECKRMAFKQTLRVKFPLKVTDDGANSHKSTCKFTVTHHLAIRVPVGVSKARVSVR